ncbi:MAG TPA: histone deacetylase [Solirubrobacterales bacterium]|nr:histone deacetylase [Solirubrobacterales bacterium]
MPLLITHPASHEHDPRPFIPGHPDTPERIAAIEAALSERDWLGWERREAPAASDEAILAVHTERLLDELRGLAESGGGRIDADTAVGPETLRAAQHAAGGACELARALLAGEHEVGLSACRPSGHHAEPDRAMGFCYFGNVAIAAELARRELGAARVMVLDWDVHHGNGTQACFWDRADVLFASIHQMPLYPGTGTAAERGAGDGEGATVNLPVRPGSEEVEWLALLDEVVAPLASRFDPDLVLVSAGFDAHRADPLASCELETESFAAMARRVRALARDAGAPLGLVLEGGYHVPSLVDSLLATMVAVAEPNLPAGP